MKGHHDLNEGSIENEHQSLLHHEIESESEGIQANMGDEHETQSNKLRRINSNASKLLESLDQLDQILSERVGMIPDEGEESPREIQRSASSPATPTVIKSLDIARES